MLAYWYNYRKINRSLAIGQLNAACALARRGHLQNNFAGRRLCKRLVTRLIKRASSERTQGRLEAAWQDLIDAASIASPALSDVVSRQTNQLVESTIATANHMLREGDVLQALKTVGLLAQRHILDQRANRIHQIGQQVVLADRLAERGEIDHARSVIYDLRRHHPELKFLGPKLKKLERKRNRLAKLTSQLRQAISDSAWGGVRRLTDQMLGITPNNRLAMDARKRCNQKSHLARAHQDSNHPQQRLTCSLAPHGNNNHELPHEPTDRPPWGARSIFSPTETRSPQRGVSKRAMKCFMLWIDGVGGYLICREPEVLVGRALPASQVDIPLQGEIDRRHLKIRRLDNTYLLEPLGKVQIDGKPLQSPLVLGHRQRLLLHGGVEIQFLQPNPIGNSAKLEIVSRHRTEPWADAIVLLGDALVLGPDRNHILCCPQWSQDRMIFRRNGKIYFRSAGVFDVNGKMQTGDIELTDKTHLSGDDFSVTCEAVGFDAP